jgi:hypothetical protein
VRDIAAKQTRTSAANAASMDGCVLAATYGLLSQVIIIIIINAASMDGCVLAATDGLLSQARIIIMIIIK